MLKKNNGILIMLNLLPEIEHFFIRQSKVMKQILIYLSLFFLSSCNLKFNQTQQTSECPQKPTAILTEENLKNVNLATDTITESNQVSTTKAVGYAFKGKSGQTLSYNTNDDICVWLYSPDNQVLSEPKLPDDGKYLLQIAAPKGSKTFKIEMSLKTISTSPSPIPTPSPSPSPSSSPSNELTQDEAEKIVKGWYELKKQAFGSSFDDSLVKQYATGQLYSDTLEKCNDGVCGGTVGWLRSKGCYYTYDFSNINEIVSFNPSSSPPSITVNVKEQLTLHGPRSAGCGTPTQTYQKNVTYWFQKESGNWKISQYKVGT